jgi:hypothetical protein
MPKVSNLEEALAAAIVFAQKQVEGTVTSIAVDAQASGEYPYRVHIAEEDLPYPGVAIGDNDALDRAGNRGGVAGVRSPEGSEHG